MQFITTDNRIAVENFQIGYFYTITFNNHNYIITTCTGKGDNFVSFLCSEPELVFDLTMQTADSIATIDLYGGGTGTTDYNNLSNKPTINSVTLTGDKTSSDLGLQSEINSENPLLSDNVDDTDQTHKFATAAQLAQITTNQNNISLMRDSDIVVRNEIDNNIYYKDVYGYTEGYFYDLYGGKTPNEQWGYTNLIPLDADTTYTVYTPTNSTLFICYYTNNETFISGEKSSSALTIPNNAAYVRISVPIVRINVFKLAKWSYNRYIKPIIKCGVGQQFTRLRDAVAEGVKYGGTVIVYSGTYDLTQEFATELSTTLTSMTGIMLANDVHVKFMSGAFVTANFDGTSESISRYFSPFIALENGSGFTLENAYITASNCRYCVHDDPASVGAYTNYYINCHMEMSTTRSTVFYPQAIGGGMGEHGTIVIDGGYYKSDSSSGYATYGQYGTAQNIQQPISYHNGTNQCYGHITISNVYLADRGYLRLGSYGSSTAKTPVEVNNCSFGLPILDMYETEQSTNRNFDIIAYNNVSRNTEVPFDFSRVIDIYTNSDDT